MSTSEKSGYHHGDLRASLVTAALAMLERGEPLSLRALAREVGVSPTAPYKHFAGLEGIEAAVAAQGLRDLQIDLLADRDLPATPQELAGFAVAYVDFAMRRPVLFRLMFSLACDEGDAERSAAAAAIHNLLGQAMTRTFPGADAEALAGAGWAYAHGMAYLHMHGKLPAGSREEVLERVRSSFLAMLALTAGGVPASPGDRTDRGALR